MKVCRPVKMLLTLTFMSLFSQVSCEAGFDRGLGTGVLESLFPQRGHLPAPREQAACPCLKQNFAKSRRVLHIDFAVFKLPPHKHPRARSCCNLRLLHRPTSGWAHVEGRAALGSVLLGLPPCAEPWFPHQTARCLSVPDIKEGPGRDSPTSSPFGA